MGSGSDSMRLTRRGEVRGVEGAAGGGRGQGWAVWAVVNKVACLPGPGSGHVVEFGVSVGLLGFVVLDSPPS